MGKKSRRNTKCCKDNCICYRKYKNMLLLILFGGLLFICSVICLDYYNQSLPITDPRRLQKVILRLVTNLPLPHSDLPSQTTTESLCRFDIIPPKKERVVCAIKKSYSIIKTLQKFDKSMTTGTKNDGNDDQQLPELVWEKIDVDATEPANTFYDIPTTRVDSELHQLVDEIEPSIQRTMEYKWQENPSQAPTDMTEQSSSSEESHTESSSGPESIDEDLIAPANTSTSCKRDPILDLNIAQSVSTKKRPPNIRIPPNTQGGKGKRSKRENKPRTPHPMELRDKVFGNFKSRFSLFDNLPSLSESPSTSQNNEHNIYKPSTSTSGKKRTLRTCDASDGKISKTGDEESQDPSNLGDVPILIPDEMNAVIESVLNSGCKLFTT